MFQDDPFGPKASDPISTGDGPALEPVAAPEPETTPAPEPAATPALAPETPAAPVFTPPPPPPAYPAYPPAYPPYQPAYPPAPPAPTWGPSYPPAGPYAAPGYPPAYPPAGPYAPPGYPPAPYPPAPYPPAPYPPQYPPAAFAQPVWQQAGVAWGFSVATPGPMPGVAWAGVGARFGALLLDTVLAVVSFVIVSVVVSSLNPTYDYAGRIEYSPAGYAVLWAWVGCFLLYHPFCWWRLEGTPGQRAVGLRVVRESDGRPLHLSQVVLRYVIWFTCNLTVILAIVAAIMADSEPRKRAWHDEAAGSVVIKPLR